MFSRNPTSPVSWVVVSLLRWLKGAPPGTWPKQHRAKKKMYHGWWLAWGPWLRILGSEVAEVVEGNQHIKPQTPWFHWAQNHSNARTRYHDPVLHSARTYHDVWFRTTKCYITSLRTTKHYKTPHHSVAQNITKCYITSLRTTKYDYILQYTTLLFRYFCTTSNPYVPFLYP